MAAPEQQVARTTNKSPGQQLVCTCLHRNDASVVQTSEGVVKVFGLGLGFSQSYFRPCKYVHDKVMLHSPEHAPW